MVAGKSERSAGRPVAVRLFWRPRVWGSFDGLCQGESGFGASLGARGRMSDRMSGSVREHGLGSRDRLGSEARLCVLSEMIHDGIVLGGFPGMVPVHGVGLPFRGRSVALEHEKGIRWMPWHQEAMKDVARCEKPWGAASRR